VNFRPLPSVSHALDAVARDASPAWAEGSSNVCIDALVGDPAATAAALAQAAHVVRFDTWVQRVAGVPMEPRAAIGSVRARAKIARMSNMLTNPAIARS
jgi:carbon-monoxide dehydrogenase large subunit